MIDTSPMLLDAIVDLLQTRAKENEKHERKSKLRQKLGAVNA